MEKPKKILVFRIGQLGDMIISIPAMQEIRNAFPLSSIVLLTDNHIGKNYLSALDIVPQNLYDRIINYPAKLGGVELKIESIVFLNNLRKEKFDSLMYLAPSNRTEVQIFRDVFLFRMLGIQKIYGHKRSSVNKYILPNHIAKNECDFLLDCLDISGIPVPKLTERTLNLNLSSKELDSAESWIKSKVLSSFSDKILIGIGPGSKAPSKKWSFENFLNLGKLIIKNFEVIPIVFGGPEDKIIGDKLVKGWGFGLNTAGEFNVRQSAAGLSFCSLYIGNDTGTMHLAAGVGITCLAIFSAQDIIGKWHPYGQNHHILRKQTECEGCRLFLCDKSNYCLQLITVEEVYACFCKIMNNNIQPLLFQ